VSGAVWPPWLVSLGWGSGIPDGLVHIHGTPGGPGGLEDMGVHLAAERRDGLLLFGQLERPPEDFDLLAQRLGRPE
jgi:hypothetical protein